MNQQTYALLLTLTDAAGRPIMLPSPVEPGAYTINGSKVVLNAKMPDCVPGATPILYGDLRKTYTLVVRSVVALTPRPERFLWDRANRCVSVPSFFNTVSNTKAAQSDSTHL
jgi:HK97 family phage major capsid protein